MNDTIKNWVIETGLRSVPTLKDRLIAEHGREAMAAAAAAGLGEELAAGRRRFIPAYSVHRAVPVPDRAPAAADRSLALWHRPASG
jgi:hypothetical protein